MPTPKENKLINKTQSETFKRLTKLQNTKDIFEEPNIKKTKINEIFRKRHGGLNIKFDNNIINNDTENKEVATQTDTTEEKKHINLKKYSYNSLTIFEDKKISKWRQKIHNELIPELDKKSNDKNQLLSSQDIITSDISKIKKELLKLRNNLIEEKMTININERIKKQKVIDNEIRKVSDLEIDIEKKEKQIKALEKNKKIQGKQIAKLKKQIKEKENKINKIKSKLNEYDNKLNIPSAKPDSWFNKSDFKIKLEKNMASSTSRKEKEKISKKISQLDEEMIKIWNGKKVEKIYEEILVINNETYFIRTFQHIDNSIREQILFFQELSNGNIEVIKQNKQYDNIHEYKKDITLIDYQNTNIKFQFASIEDFLNKQEESNLNITKSEWITFLAISIFSLCLLSVPAVLTIYLPTIIIGATVGIIIAEKIGILALSTLVIGALDKVLWNLVSHKTQKFKTKIKNSSFSLLRKLPFCKSIGKNKEEKEIKNNFKKTIENLTIDKLETKLQAQYDILKQELNLNKNKNVSELISTTIMRHKSNNLLENSSIESENNHNFDSIIKKTINNQNQFSTSTGIHHSNLI
ncbi:hypothetical protein [Spiroplasma ixodetis]|uniref:hypothetical protein n=1 Tax=Spiroplasma ixodetis TaxID=2141 RepID=UPI002493C744|nr:hypothetical protein [Spiroplasma ixodetis]